MLLSVIIPTWNRAHLVCDAINSALNQRPGEVEVIVVDDASTDNTAHMLADTHAEGIRVLRRERRGGSGAARNAGVALARGEFVGFLDSDDVWLPGKFEAELRVFEQFSEAEAVFSDGQNFFERVPDGPSRFVQNGLLEATRGQISWANQCNWLWTNSANSVQTCSVTVRREALARIGTKLFAEDLDCCEDWEFQMHVCHLCRVIVLPKILAHVRRFEDDSRSGRGIPGRTKTRDQELMLLRDRLTVMRRATWLKDLELPLANELDRFRTETANKLSELHG